MSDAPPAEAAAPAAPEATLREQLAAEITEKLSIPTIGIGAGMHCDGQVLVLHDLLGLSERTFTFAKRYADLRTAAIDAIGAYAAEVRTGEWPDDAHSYH